MTKGPRPGILDEFAGPSYNGYAGIDRTVAHIRRKVVIMKTALSCLAWLGLSIVVGGQVAGAPEKEDSPRQVHAILKAKQMGTETKSDRLPGGGFETSTFFTAQGVVIQIESSILTADKALISRGAAGAPDDVQLSGNVRLKTSLIIK